ncbi:MAG TPA: 4-hydroxyphenylacetate 3-hydroxylase N-terminal domain-containing protein [Novosphingobium sp.]|nr:4-hydroxyphenylacetate 3-hydroxylase N-terminal domain-containing protein [Novosphingobium sp.]
MDGAQYRQSLADGRRVFHGGQEVADVATHPAFASMVDTVADGYDRMQCNGSEPAGLWQPPRTVAELRQQLATRLDSLTEVTFMTASALLTAATRIKPVRPQGSAAIAAFLEAVRAGGLRVAECITDAKGDRSVPPVQQVDPEAYLRVVERRADGVVLRGAKLHIAHAAICHELVIMPTKAMKAGEESYAIACAVPVASPGVIVVNAGSPPTGDERDYPFTRDHFVSHGFVIFDDVFVPNERIFLDGETACAATFAHSLGLWNRAQGIATMADDADLLVGFAQLITEANGLTKVPHIREKITSMAIHATLLRACLEASLANSNVSDEGYIEPNELYATAGRFLGSEKLSAMIRDLHDIAGGSVQTAPSMADIDSAVTGPFIRRYMATPPHADGEHRARLFHAIRDLTMTSYGSYRTLASLIGGGGLFAQRIVARKLYDMGRATRMALAEAGLGPGGD